MDTTIESYINPEVILRFVSRGEIEDDLYDAVMTNDRRLHFDPEVFVNKANQKLSHTHSSGLHIQSWFLKDATSPTPKEVLRRLEEDMRLIGSIGQDTLDVAV
jgi:hypothetical protein